MRRIRLEVTGNFIMLFCALVIFVIYAIVTLFYVIATSIRDYCRDIKFLKVIRVEQKACHSNCKAIMEAIGKYNNDHPSNHIESISHITGEDFNGNEMGPDYMENIACPGNRCHYWYEKESSEVYCVCHGSPSQSWNLDIIEFYLPSDDYIPSNDGIRKYLVEETIKAEKNVLKKYIVGLPKKYLSALIEPISGCVNYLLYLIIFKGRRINR